MEKKKEDGRKKEKREKETGKEGGREREIYLILIVTHIHNYISHSDGK